MKKVSQSDTILNYLRCRTTLKEGAPEITINASRANSVVSVSSCTVESESSKISKVFHTQKMSQSIQRIQ
ncbi:hypothetical protein HOG98_08540 [bacterium]|nr:hypothetical protein [bacterium]